MTIHPLSSFSAPNSQLSPFNSPLSVLRSPLLALCSLLFALSSYALEPLESKRGSLLFEDNFDSGSAKIQWTALHGTRWSVEEGVYTGIPSTQAFQDSRENHKGTTPSMRLNVPARDCIIEMDFKITGALSAAHIGFNNSTTAAGTGHIVRLIPSTNKGTVLQKDRHSQMKGDLDLSVANSEWTIKSDTWYTVLIEAIGDRIVAQIEGGPTLRADHWRFDVLKTSVNLKARGQEGSLSYDQVKIWEALPKGSSQSESGASWIKHVVIESEDKGMINSAVADDFDGDGVMDIIGSTVIP